MGINAHRDHVSLSDIYKILPAHKQMGDTDIFPSQSSKLNFYSYYEYNQEGAIIGWYFKTVMTMKVNFKDPMNPPKIRNLGAVFIFCVS